MRINPINMRHFENPIITNLKLRLNEYKKELAELIGNWYYFKNILFPQLEFIYDSYFGDLETRIDEKNNILSELQERIYQLRNQIRVNNNGTYYSFKDNATTLKSDKSKNKPLKLNDIFSKIEKEIEGSKLPAFEINLNYELPQLYRQIVKEIHPDLNGITDNYEIHWNNVQDAYQNKNVFKMRLLYKIICKNNFIDSLNIKNDERILKDEIRDIEKNIIKERNKINKLLQHEPFIFKDKFDDNNWIANRRAKMEDYLNRLDNRICYNQETLNDLTHKLQSLKGTWFIDSKIG
jgi:hypothetical protein